MKKPIRILKINWVKRFFHMSILQNHRNKVSFIGNIILLILSAWAHYSMANRFYAIFLILYCLFLLFSRTRVKALFILPILAMTIFQLPVLNTLLEIQKLSFDTLIHPKSALTNIFKPNSGQEYLPVQIQNMNTLLNNHDIPSFQLSDKIADDPMLFQRITEVAWPRKLDNSSQVYLISREELNLYPLCNILDQREDIILAECH